MKYVLISCLFLTIGLISCDKTEDPTTFRGEVVFPEDYALEEDDVVSVAIAGFKSRGIGTPSDGVATDGMDLDSENRFEITFPSLEVDDFALGINIIDSDSTLKASLRGSDLDCSPYDCSDFQPGETYNLTVRVVE